MKAPHINADYPRLMLPRITGLFSADKTTTTHWGRKGAVLDLQVIFEAAPKEMASREHC